ncbi:MAG: efflux RND transporter periplasmic adaptor subunit [Saprospiraceae bacterium]|nr:efflux RND transporter periplasmic adaptor subunit [Saprospiraceae bacterium]
MKNVIVCSILLSLLLSFAGCRQKDVEPAAAQDSHTHHHDEEGHILLTKAQYDQAGIQTGGFSSRLVQEYTTASAELFLGKEHTAAVSAFTEGIVSELKVSLNQSVRKGDIIAVLHKPDLLNLQQEYLEQKALLPFLRAEFERYKALASDNATASKNFQKAEAELRQAETSLAIQAAKLKQLQMAPEQVSADNLKTTLLLKAPISGRITAIYENVGAMLTPGATLCDIADYSKIQPVVYVFEKDIFRVKPGAKVLLHFPAAPERTYSAVIYSMEGSVDQERKALRAFARFENAPTDNLIEGAFMEARIAPAAGSETAVLPVSAVVREGDGEYIFVLEGMEEGGYVFRKVAAKTGATADGFVAVSAAEALPADARIVVKGAYYVSAQSAELDHEH